MKKIHVELKRLASILLAMAMLLVSVPMAFPTYAAAAAASGTTGDCTWSLDSTVLTVSGNGAMGDYSYSSPSPWGTGITKIIITDGVTSIGAHAFEDCRTLTDVIIPDSVTSIGDCAFEDCRSLMSITIPGSVRSIGAYAFAGCRSLTNPNILEGVVGIGAYAFSGCVNLAACRP